MAPAVMLADVESLDDDDSDVDVAVDPDAVEVAVLHISIEYHCQDVL